MANKKIYIPIDDTQNNPCIIHTISSCNVRLYKPTKIQCKSPKFLSQQIRKTYYKTLGTSVINSPISPPSLAFACVELNRKLIFIEKHVVEQNFTQVEKQYINDFTVQINEKQINYYLLKLLGIVIFVATPLKGRLVVFSQQLFPYF